MTARTSLAHDGGQGSETQEAVISTDGSEDLFSNYSNQLARESLCFQVPCGYVRAPDSSDADADLTRDGDVDDTVLEALDVQTGEVVSFCAATVVSVAGRDAAFLRPEASGNSPNCPTGENFDLNGDGDASDAVVHFVQHGGPVRNLGVAATDLSLSEKLLAALVSEAADGGRDRNDDGDGLDGVVWIHGVDESEERWINLGRAGDVIDVVGSTLVFTVPEASHAHRDLNLDGDAVDRVIHVYDLGEGRLIPLGQASEDFVLGPTAVAFRTSESAQGSLDLNVDGDADDDVLQVYDMISRRLFNTHQAVTPCRFEACDPRVPYRVSGDAVTFLTLEADQGERDLDGDGDSRDIVLQVFNVREAAERATGAGTMALAVADPASAPSQEDAAASVKPLGAVEAGLCTNTAEPCASDEDCSSGGSCFLPPGHCIRRLTDPCALDRDCEPGQFCLAGTCHVDLELDCRSDAICRSFGAACHDAAGDVVRLFSPIAISRADGRQAFVSAAARPGADASDPSELVTVGVPDTDADSVVDPFDNCPERPNPDQADLDRDQVGDCCDLGGPDQDSDGMPDPMDNCVERANPDQRDSDFDGFGNRCDADYTNDGVVDYSDLALLIGGWGSRSGSEGHPARIDVDGDGVIGGPDLAALGRSFLGAPGPAGSCAAAAAIAGSP